VLVVDDDPDVLRALASELETFADVETLGSVTAALALIEPGRFDVVVADLRMPDRWGDELLAYVAARSPATRRFLLTGDSDPRRTVRELIDHGVVEAFFRKPRAEGLIDAIRGTQGGARTHAAVPAHS
jgi:DNA-binding NtrC family response regulator